MAKEETRRTKWNGSTENSVDVLTQPFLFADKFKWKSQISFLSKCLCHCFPIFTLPVWFLLTLISLRMTLCHSSPSVTEHRNERLRQP